MNVVAKSTTVSPFLKTATTAVANSMQPVAGSSVVLKSKIVTKPVPRKMISLSMLESLITRPLRVSTGIGASFQVVQRRLAHSDVKWPDFGDYRRESVTDPNTKSRESAPARKTFSYLLTAGAGVCGAYTAKAIVHDLVSTLSASADVLALAKIEVKLDSIPEGKSAIFKWRGKPIFIRHRTAKEIEKEEAVDLGTLRDPQHDKDRVRQPEWLVVIGVCTHLGCVPIANAGDFSGYYCPCHGSHYDASGRIRKGPAPLNLEVPFYQFIDDQTVVIG